MKYITPISRDPIGSIDEKEENEELQKKLRINFYKQNQTVHTQIMDAVAAGDTKLAHRLTHSLEGNAGLIGKTALRSAAAEVEVLLKDGLESVWENKMNLLKAELVSVLEEFKTQFDKQEETQALSTELALALLEKLQPMLENDNTDSVSLLDELRSVSGAEDLMKQIEDFDFKSAFRTLIILKKTLEENHE